MYYDYQTILRRKYALENNKYKAIVLIVLEALLEKMVYLSSRKAFAPINVYCCTIFESDYLYHYIYIQKTYVHIWSNFLYINLLKMKKKAV